MILHSKGDYVCYDVGQETGLMAQEAATDTFPNVGPTQNHTAADLCQSTQQLTALASGVLNYHSR